MKTLISSSKCSGAITLSRRKYSVSSNSHRILSAGRYLLAYMIIEISHNLPTIRVQSKFTAAEMH